MFISLITVFSVYSDIKLINKRSFPTFSAYLFDLKKNFFSRITFRTFFKASFYLRILAFFFVFGLVNIFSAGTSFNMEHAEKKAAQTLAIIVNNVNNVPLRFYESIIVKKKTSLVFNQVLQLITKFETIPQVDGYNQWLKDTGNKTALQRAGLLFPEDLAKFFPQEDRRNCFFPSQEITENGKNLYSPQKISESYFSWACGQNNSKIIFENYPRVIFENNPKIKSKGLLFQNVPPILKVEGEYIVENVIIDKKSFDVDRLDPENAFYIFKKPTEKMKSFVFHKIISILQMNKGYHYLLVVDLTGIELALEKKNILFRDFEKLIKLCPHTFSEWENKKVHLRFIERIPGNIETTLTKLIKENDEITRITNHYDFLLQKARQQNETPKDVFQTARNLKNISEKENFNPVQEILKTGIFDFSEKNSKPEILKSPYDFYPKEKFLDRTKNFSSVVANPDKVLKNYDSGNSNLESSIKWRQKKVLPAKPNLEGKSFTDFSDIYPEIKKNKK